ncbi:MAG: hypothetical protein FJ144_17330 [Deltaproteobacteria bacterium]|nr:hypothetical protein [Deltaproteobacteria bacterium]
MHHDWRSDGYEVSTENFGLYHGEEQVGYARLAKWLVATILSHQELQGLRRWMPITRDAHGLYEPLGFRPCARPDQLMETVVPDAYRRRSAS